MRRARKKRSACWKYFKLVGGKAVCQFNLCMTELVWHGSTTALNAHLQAKHSDFIKVNPDLKGSPIASNQDYLSPNASTSLSAQFNSYQNNNDEILVPPHSEIDKKICDWIASEPKQSSPNTSMASSAQFNSHQSNIEEALMLSNTEIDKKICNWISSEPKHASAVEESSFLDLIYYLAPSYKVPSTNAITEMINVQYFSKKSKLQDCLFLAAEKGKMSLSVGFFTNGCRWLILRAHYVTDTWRINSLVIGFVREKAIDHNSGYLAKWINDKINDFALNLGSVICIVHDGDDTISTAVGILAEAYGCNTLLSCESILRFVMKNLCNDPTFTDVLGAIQDVVQFYSDSEVGKFLTKQHNGVGINITNSKQNFQDDSHILTSLHNHHSSAVYEKAASIVHVLQPIDAALSFFKRDEFVFSSSVPILLSGLQKKLGNDLNNALNFVKMESGYQANSQSSQQTSKWTQIFKEKLVKSLQNVTVFSSNDITAVAAALDPRYKKLFFVNAEDRENVRSILATECYVHYKDEASIDGENCEPPTKQVITEKISSTNSLMDDILKLGAGCQENEEQYESGDDALQAKIKKEMETYFSEKSPASDICPLKWWEANQSRFSILAKVARVYLCIPATTYYSAEQKSYGFTAAACAVRPHNKLAQ